MPDPTHDELLLLAFIVGQIFRISNKSRESDNLVLCYMLVTIAFDDPSYWLAATFGLIIARLLQGLANVA